jgi:hypothetical protein
MFRSLVLALFAMLAFTGTAQALEGYTYQHLVASKAIDYGGPPYALSHTENWKTDTTATRNKHTLFAAWRPSSIRQATAARLPETRLSLDTRRTYRRHHDPGRRGQ